MLPTYEAILNGNHLEWSGDAPEQGRRLRVHVTVVDAPAAPATEIRDDSHIDRGKRMAEALAKLAEMNAFKDITDPVAWQREIRKDRPLPGREE